LQQKNASSLGLHQGRHDMSSNPLMAELLESKKYSQLLSNFFQIVSSDQLKSKQQSRF